MPSALRAAGTSAHAGAGRGLGGTPAATKAWEINLAGVGGEYVNKGQSGGRVAWLT